MTPGVTISLVKIVAGKLSSLMPTKKQDEQFAAHLPIVVGYHTKMLSDGVRNELLYRAIKRVVDEKTHFLDVGAGSGAWAILSAKLGAKRVVAVELEEAL